METLNLLYNVVIPRDTCDLDEEVFIDLSFLSFSGCLSQGMLELNMLKNADRQSYKS